MHWTKLLPQSGTEWALCAIGAIAVYLALCIVLAFGTVYY